MTIEDYKRVKKSDKQRQTYDRYGKMTNRATRYELENKTKNVKKEKKGS